MAKSATTTRVAIREALEEFRGLLHEPKPDMALVSTMLGTLDVDVKPHVERYVVDVMTRRGMLEQFCKSYGTQSEREVGVPAEGWFVRIGITSFDTEVYYNGRRVEGVLEVHVNAHSNEFSSALIRVDSVSCIATPSNTRSEVEYADGGRFGVPLTGEAMAALTPEELRELLSASAGGHYE